MLGAGDGNEHEAEKMNPQEAYDELVERSKELFTIGSVNALVGWDQRVNMPPGGHRPAEPDGRVPAGAGAPQAG